jgi:hypothetical protein
MARKKRPPPEERARKMGNSRWYLRQVEAFGRRLAIGTKIAKMPLGSRKDEVERLRIKYGVSERYLWGTVKLAQRIEAKIWTNRPESPPLKQPRPFGLAILFLLQELRNGPRPMTEIQNAACKARISPRTLRRAAESYVVRTEKYITKRHVGGSHGYWIWDLSDYAKKLFMTED